MNYLSPQIEVLAKKKIKKDAPLVRKGFSCGIFQEYGNNDFSSAHTTVEFTKR